MIIPTSPNSEAADIADAPTGFGRRPASPRGIAYRRGSRAGRALVRDVRGWTESGTETAPVMTVEEETVSKWLTARLIHPQTVDFRALAYARNVPDLDLCANDPRSGIEGCGFPRISRRLPPRERLLPSGSPAQRGAPPPGAGRTPTPAKPERLRRQEPLRRAHRALPPALPPPRGTASP